MSQLCSYSTDKIDGYLASQAAYEGSIPFARSNFSRSSNAYAQAWLLIAADVRDVSGHRIY